MMRQHVVLCEGFDDRAFWAGWLTHLGCEDPTALTATGKRSSVIDAWGQEVERGKFLFTTPQGSKILVHPFHGRHNVRKAVNKYLTFLETHPIGRLIINLDSDDESTAGTGSALDVIGGIVRAHKGGSTSSAFDIQGLPIFPVIWECDDSESPGIPTKQTLERLVSAAIVSAYPGRGRSVSDWLQSKPTGGDTHKHHGMSYFAKWYALNGHADFYRGLWRDAAVARELELRLRRTGAWESVAALVAD